MKKKSIKPRKAKKPVKKVTKKEKDKIKESKKTKELKIAIEGVLALGDYLQARIYELEKKYSSLENVYRNNIHKRLKALEGPILNKDCKEVDKDEKESD
jgi:hypothetical protein